jgi:hypothetical protein
VTKELWIVADMDFGKQEYELGRLNPEILDRREVTFRDGTREKQWTIKDESGQRWHLTPTSRAAHVAQLDSGRWLSPYVWVRG